jgi:hypothetical protein
VPWEVAGRRRDICIHVLGNRLCERPEAEHAQVLDVDEDEAGR